MKLLCLMAASLIVLPAIAEAQSTADRQALVDPPEISSKDGFLSTRLTVATHTIEVGGKTVTTELYNGLFAPPTIRVRPGDRLMLELVNRRQEPTNLHYHGTNTSPKGNGDNVYLSVNPGTAFQYQVDFPDDHPQGMFYYHPHYHGTTEYQIGSGMSGFLSVDGVLDPWPELQKVKRRTMILRDIQIDKGVVPDPLDPGNPTMRLINGQLNPTIPIQPGEIQFWRVGNVGADIYYDLEIEGHKIYEVARDGIRHNQLVEHDHLLLPTSSRSDFFVVGGEPGEYIFRTREIDMGPAGDPHPRTTLGTLVVSGPVVTGIELPKTFPPGVADLRDVVISCPRTFDFSETADGSQFCINNTGTDMNITNTTVRIGGVEEWTINNCSAENHVFHHHQLQFQVVRKNGKDVPFTGWQDTISLDYRAATDAFPNRCKCDDDGGNCTDCTCPTAEDPHGSVVVRIPFLNPVIEGKAVYHCHIGEHEDNGMMHTITMSKSANFCEAGTPSSTTRHSLSSRKRAYCAPRPDEVHDHASMIPVGKPLAAEGSLAQLLAMLDGKKDSLYCVVPQGESPFGDVAVRRRLTLEAPAVQ